MDPGLGRRRGRRKDIHPSSCQVDFASALRLEAKTEALKIRATDSRTAQELADHQVIGHQPRSKARTVSTIKTELLHCAPGWEMQSGLSQKPA